MWCAGASAPREPRVRANERAAAPLPPAPGCNCGVKPRTPAERGGAVSCRGADGIVGLIGPDPPGRALGGTGVEAGDVSTATGTRWAPSPLPSPTVRAVSVPPPATAPATA